MSYQKNQQFSQEIRSKQRREHFESERKKFQRAKMQQDHALQAQAEMQMLNLCQNKEMEVKMLLEMYENLEQKEVQYENYLAQLEEESTNFELKQRREEIVKIKQQMEGYFDE